MSEQLPRHSGGDERSRSDAYGRPLGGADRGVRCVIRADGAWADGEHGTVKGPSTVLGMFTIELDHGGRYLARVGEVFEEVHRG